MAGVLFEDIFDVKDIDPEGKKFDRGKKYLFIIFLISCVIWHWLLYPIWLLISHVISMWSESVFLRLILVLTANSFVDFTSILG